MSNRTIAENLALIESAVYGRDVRSAIHDSIEQCYDDVTESATLANAAAQAADNAAAACNDATASVEDAVEAAETATTAANTAASSASTAAADAVSNCSAAATAANTATMSANAAISSISNITVTSENVAYTESADAVISDVSGHKNIHFKLKQGEPGTPYTIKGDAYATLADLQANVQNPTIGDNYNVGTEPPYTIYRWTGTTWENQGSISVSIDKISDQEINYIYAGTNLTGDSKYLGIAGLSYLMNSKLTPALANKVDVVQGKGLSTNDFTTVYKDKVDQNEADISSLSSAMTNKSDLGKIKIGATEYTMRIDTAGAAGYVTFVLET